MPNLTAPPRWRSRNPRSRDSRATGGTCHGPTPRRHRALSPRRPRRCGGRRGRSRRYRNRGCGVPPRPPGPGGPECRGAARHALRYESAALRGLLGWVALGALANVTGPATPPQRERRPALLGRRVLVVLIVIIGIVIAPGGQPIHEADQCGLAQAVRDVADERGEEILLGKPDQT